MSDELDASMRRSRRLYEEIFGKGNYGVADDLMAADIVNHGPGVPPAPGTEGIKRQAALLRTAIPDLRVILNDQFGHGDRVVSRWTGSGTHAGPLNLPTGSDVDRLARRLRAVSERLEAVEDTLDELNREVAALRRERSSRQASGQH